METDRDLAHKRDEARRERAFARAYGRRASVLAAEGKSAEQIRDLLSPAKQAMQMRHVEIDRGRERLEKVIPFRELEKQEKTLQAKGLSLSSGQLQGLLDSPASAKSMAEGDPLPLIKSIISLTSTLANVRKANNDGAIQGLPPETYPGKITRETTSFPRAKSEDNDNAPTIFKGPEVK